MSLRKKSTLLSRSALLGSLIACSLPLYAQNPADFFKENKAWVTTTKASAVGNKLQLAPNSKEGNILALSASNGEHLIAHEWLGDSVLDMEFLVTEGSDAQLFIQGRYAVPLKNVTNEWQHLRAKFRAPRYNEASIKTEPALILEVTINGEPVLTNDIRTGLSEGSSIPWEGTGGPTSLLVKKGQMALRNFTLAGADFSLVTVPKNSGEATNEKELVDFVALGKETFGAVGCNACHLVSADDSGVSTGPNLYGLFKREPRNREVVEGGEGHRFTVKADRQYLHRSLREPEAQLAISESGAKKGEPYLPIMPAFSAQVLSDVQIDAIGDYLATLNPPAEQGPAIKLLAQTGAEEYDPVKDRLQFLVGDEVRIQRGPMVLSDGFGSSGRAIHVGTPWGVNYTFDPRLLAITKIWQGGFLDMSGEFLNRGGKGLKMGFESREISLGSKAFLLAPLNAKGEVIDFSFKEAQYGDAATVKASLESKEDHLPRVAAMDAQFLGYFRDSKQKQQLPSFKYRVGKNTLEIQTSIAADGNVTVTVKGELASPQSFALNGDALQNISSKQGQIANQQWTLPAGKINASLSAKMTLANNPWRPEVVKFNHYKQPVKITESKANMPTGYKVESYYPPKDNFGREQLFEALGLSLTEDNTVVIATRTAGIWRMVKGQWQLFAEGTFDSLGVIAEDKKGLTVVVGQKAELTRISDTNGDGVADKFDTLFDAHSYHGNYHTYMHGPARGSDGAYYISLNLAHNEAGSSYKAGGQYMGTEGGLGGWNIRVEPNGKFTPWAYGLRSPAGLGTSPDGRLWYSDNQGEYMSTSKIFVIEKDAYYGHPSALVDLPGVTPEMAEKTRDSMFDKRADAIILLPHNRVANSPGHPAWDTTKGKFGPYAGQMLMGDQTQSNLLRIAVQSVDGKEQGSVMPFIDGLESGVMRPLFLKDGSLLLGQTGRGWQAKGGHVASLQRIVWDGKTVAPAITEMLATPTGFSLQLTQPLAAQITAEQLQSLLALESWVYRDAAEYGSDELGMQKETIKALRISADRKSIEIDLASLAQAKVHPQQTARVYHANLNSKTLFAKDAPEKMEAYYTLYKFPAAKK
ncbi:DUF7133 domain-containing protein [Cellvibrio fontiphilus]|uniref:Cytochrome c domain-containing protein n=1 Tax=Cellvibrio fontiphilus TaxID=1815559 RepID=A0ABV7FKJ5_9GAMM